MVKRGLALSILDAPTEASPVSIEASRHAAQIDDPCCICGAPALAYWPDSDSGQLYCVEHWPVGDARKARWTADPRSDIAADSALWVKLLSLAYDYDHDDPRGLFGALHGLRCGGAKLLPVPPDRARLTRGEWEADQYAQLREQYLVPQAEALGEMLTRVRRKDGN